LIKKKLEERFAHLEKVGDRKRRVGEGLSPYKERGLTGKVSGVYRVYLG